MMVTAPLASSLLEFLIGDELLALQNITLNSGGRDAVSMLIAHEYLGKVLLSPHNLMLYTRSIPRTPRLKHDSHW
jgi:hypothetical protein